MKINWRAVYVALLWLGLGWFSLPAIAESQNAAPWASLPDCAFSVPNARVGALVLDFKTGLGCAQALDELFQVASVLKIFLAGAYYDYAAQGLINLDSTLEFSPQYFMAGRTDCLNEERLGERIPIRQLLRLMLNCSDNPATAMLYDALGGASYRSYLQARGISIAFADILPYAEVDKRKLVALDPRWEAVPTALASRFYRVGLNDGLEAYFNPVPRRLNRAAYGFANQAYFTSASTNRTTVHTLAQYLYGLRTVMQSDPFSATGRGALQLFTSLLYTPRLHSSQALDGGVLVGAKNGFDRGVVAEVNVLFDDLSTRLPSGLVIVLSEENTHGVDAQQPPNAIRGILNDALRGFAPRIAQILNLTPAPARLVPQLSSALAQSRAAIESCWQSYAATGFSEDAVTPLERCFAALTPLTQVRQGTDLSIGAILRGLGGTEHWLGFRFSAPDGTHAHYQTSTQNVNLSGVYWYHPATMRGTWTLELYVDLQKVWAGQIEVQ